MIKYTITANEDGREATQYITTGRPQDTLDVTPVNELVAPDPDQDYWDMYKEIVYAPKKGLSNEM